MIRSDPSTTTRTALWNQAHTGPSASRGLVGAMGLLVLIGLVLLAFAFRLATSELVAQGNAVCGQALAVTWRDVWSSGGEPGTAPTAVFPTTCVGAARHRVLIAAALAGGGLLLLLSAAVLQLSARNQATAES